MFYAINRPVPFNLLLINVLAVDYDTRPRNVPARRDWNHFQVRSPHRVGRMFSGHTREVSRVCPLAAGLSL
jgi:hypothetical protein